MQKVAAVLIALGPEKSAEVLAHLEAGEVERIARELAKMDQLDQPTKRQVLEEFRQRCASFQEVERGGLEFAEELVRKALGPRRAAQVVALLRSRHGEGALAHLQRSEVNDILRLVADEHPQVAALMLASLSPRKAAAVLAGLPAPMRAQTALRVAKSEPMPPTVATRLAHALEHKASSLGLEQAEVQAGRNTLVEILKHCDRATERTVLETLSQQDPDLGEYLRDRMFVFEDLARLEGRSLQLVLREVDQEDLRVALRGAGEDMREVVFQNMSEAAREVLKEDLEVGQPVRLREVEERQQKIAGVVRRMVESGAIALATEEEELV